MANKISAGHVLSNVHAGGPHCNRRGGCQTGGYLISKVTFAGCRNMSDIPPKNPLQNEPGSSGDRKKRAEDNENWAPSADFAALIKTIKNQGRAYRREEQREDRGHARRERITIGLLFLTVIGIFWQIYEMIHVYGPIHEQAVASGKQATASEKAAEATTRAAAAATRQSENSDRAMIQAQRAWLGPRNATFSAEPKIGEFIDVTIEYQNTGREPALNFAYEKLFLS